MARKNDRVDIVIIGSGAAGAAAAWNLSDSGFKVVCLEQGPKLSASDYPANFADWELRKQSSFNVDPNVRKLPSDYPIDDSDSAIAIANFNAVGGSTILFSGHFPRFHPSDFMTRTLDGVGADWPFGYDALEPYYEINDKMIGVAGLGGDPAYPDIPNLLPPVPIGKMGEVIAEAFNRLGWHWWPSYAALITRDFQGRSRCENTGPCNTGCPNGSKSSADVTYMPLAVKNGVELRSQCRVLRVTQRRAGKVDGVVYVDADGVEHFQEADLVIVACNGVGTPRLLLNSKSPQAPDGLANSSGLVGKNLMLHPLGFVEGKFDVPLGSSAGPQGACVFSHEFYETEAERGFARGYTMHVLRGGGPLETATSARRFNDISFGPGFHDGFKAVYGRNIPVAIICEDLPEETNCVQLDDTQTDSSGMPGAKIHYKLGDNTKKMLGHGLKKGKELMKAAGAVSVRAHGPVRHTGWHLMGTTKMGVDPVTSVVNPHGQTHDAANLMVIDSSIFATSGGVNPASTIQALALKLTDGVKKNPGIFR